jgi:hypothetical protein
MEVAIRAAAAWLLIAILAVLNGILREKVLMDLLGERIALMASAIILSIVIILVAYFTFDFVFSKLRHATLAVGFQWFFMTLLFEFTFGYFVAGKSLPEILLVFNVQNGNLFLLVLLATLTAPYIAGRLKTA